MENFNYHRPATTTAAAAMLKKAKDGKYLAGGHTLIPTMKQGLATPTDVIDLTAIKGFSGIKVSKTTVTIKAGTTHQEVATSKDVKIIHQLAWGWVPRLKQTSARLMPTSSSLACLKRR